jgi:DNA polymerase III alpha subunit
MKELDTKFLDDYGNVIFKENYLFDIIYSGETDLSKFIAFDRPSIQKHNYYSNFFDQKDKCITIYQPPDLDIKTYDKEYQNNWFIPSRYNELDVFDFIIKKCKTEEELQRVAEEYVLFEQYNMIPVLRLMIYLVEVMRENKIVWGVGRGSSVASYILYLIGVHKVNSLLHNLPIEEFLHC